MNFYGIDPGKKGGIAKIDTDGDLLFFKPMPCHPYGYLDVPELVKILFGQFGPIIDDHYAIERAQAMPRQGISSTFKYATDYGRIRGVIESRAPAEKVHLPRPQTWKVVLETGRDKQAAINLVESVYPDINLILPGKRVKHDGCADAISIALWCRRTHHPDLAV